MATPPPDVRSPSATVMVRMWAGAKAAAGVGEVPVAVDGTVSVAWLTRAVVSALPDRPRLAEVLSVCSVLVGDRPVGTADPSTVEVQPGETVEFLPPFAGG